MITKLHERVHEALIASPSPITASSMAIMLGITVASAGAALRYLQERCLAAVTRTPKRNEHLWRAVAKQVRHLPLVLGHVSSGGVERSDCVHDDDCLSKLVRKEPEAEVAMCRRACPDYQPVDRDAEFMHLAMSSVGGGWGTGEDESEEAAE